MKKKIIIMGREFEIGVIELMLIATAILEFNPFFQTLKIIQSKTVGNVSIATFASILTIGAMWLVYGIKIRSLPLIIGNAVKLTASLSVVVSYYVFK